MAGARLCAFYPTNHQQRVEEVVFALPVQWKLQIRSVPSTKLVQPEQEDLVHTRMWSLSPLMLTECCKS